MRPPRAAFYLAALVVVSMQGGVASAAAPAKSVMPDWSGMWTPGAKAPEVAGKKGTSLPRGSGAFGSKIPFNPKYQALADARWKRVQGAGGVDDIPLSNSGFCIPAGVPSNMGLVSHEYVLQPNRVLILLENSEVRRIWTDGHGHPPDDVSNPDFQGHSIGHWEGDTLVVDTRQIYPEAELFFGLTVTDRTVMKERISLVDRNTLRIDTIVEDDELFSRPWTYTRYYARENREAIPYESCTLADRAQKSGDKLIGIDFDANKLKPGEKQKADAEKALAEREAAGGKP